MEKYLNIELNKDRDIFKFISLFCVVLYIPILSFDFIWDDFELYNNFIHKGFFELVSTKLDSIYAIHYYPVFHLSHQIDYHLSKIIFLDQENQSHFTYAIIPHISNLIYYSITCFFFYLVTQFFFLDRKIRIFISLIFAAHPVHINSVAWISGRTDLLATLFCILTIYFFCKLIRENNKKHNLFIALLFYFLAIFSKEVSLTLIGTLFLISFYFYKKDKINLSQINFQIIFFIISCFFILFFFYLFFKFTQIDSADSILSFDTRNFLNILYDGLKILSFYFVKLFIPFDHNIVASELPNKGHLFFGLFIFSLLVLFSLNEYFSKKNLLPAVFLISILFSSTTAFYSFFRGSGGQGDEAQLIISTIAERFAFLPSVFSVLLLGLVFLKFKPFFKDLVPILILIFFSCLLILRLPSHKNQESYAEYTPKEKRLVYHYMVLLQSYKDPKKYYKKIKLILDEAIRKYPKKSKFYIRYAFIEDQNDNPEKAKTWRKKARDLHKNDQYFNYFAGLLFYKENNYDVAKGYLYKSIETTKDIEKQIRSLLLLSKIELKLKNNESAKKLLETILKVDPENADTLFVLGNLYIQLGNKDKAIQYIEKAIEYDPKILNKLKMGN